MIERLKAFGSYVARSFRWLVSDSANVFETKPYSAGVLAVVLVLILNAVTAYVAAREASDSSSRISNAAFAMSRLDQVLVNLKDAEAGQQEFLMTGFDGKFRNSRTEVLQSLRDLKKLFASYPTQTMNMAEFDEAVRTRLEKLKDSIDANAARALDVTAPLVKVDAGQRESEQISRSAVQIRTAQNDLYSQLVKTREGHQHRLTLTFWLSTAINAGLVILVSFLVRRIIDGIYRARRREQLHAQEATARNQELLTEMQRRRKAEKEIQALNTDLEARVVERTHELRRAYEEAEGLNYTIAHDLRAPLRAIISSSHILLEDYGQELNPEVRDELLRQSRAANQLAQLIDDLLEMSRLTRQEMTLQEVDLTEIARSVVDELRARSWSAQPVVEIQPGIKAYADPILMKLLLQNLLENAFKFSPEGGKVAVGRQGDLSNPIYYVRDEGIGFDKEYEHRIFLPFERLSARSDIEGTGIGLANVKRIAERHDGRVWAESEPGRGSTFYFTLGAPEVPTPTGSPEPSGQDPMFLY